MSRYKSHVSGKGVYPIERMQLPKASKFLREVLANNLRAQLNQQYMKCLMEGGAMVPVPGGKNGKTFKSQTQSGMMSVQPFWPLLVGGKPVRWADLEALKDETKFAEHKIAARNLGFELLVKRAAVGSSKHVRVRPQFAAGWQARGQLAVWDDQITEKALSDILQFSGQYKGVGDWRPGAPKKPGPYGTFEAEIG